MAAETVSRENFFSRIYNLKDTADCKAFYDKYAASYDSNVHDPTQNYRAPALVAQAVAAAGVDLTTATIFDAGCGTGLCGVALAQAGARTVDGVDLSEGMLAVARGTGTYRELAPADLSQPLRAQPDARYDAVTCVGTLTKAHVGPAPALPEFVRILKRGGVVVATVIDPIWEPEGYKAEVERLEAEGKVEVLSTEFSDYRADVKARIIVLRKR